MAPSIIIALMAPSRSFFTAPVWDHVLALVTGMTLAPGKRTVSATLRVVGLGQARDFRALPPRAQPGAMEQRRHRRQTAADDPRPVLALRTGRDRHRTPLGPQDRGARHLPRSRALLAWSLRQDERLALAGGDGHGSRAMDSATLGSAVSHHPRSFRTLRRRARASPQKADRLGSPSHTSGSPMGAQAQYRRRRRLQLLGARSDRRGSPPRLFGHEAATRRQSVRARAAAPLRTARTAAQERSSASQTLPGARKQSDALGQTVDALLVRRSTLHSPIHDRNGGLVSPRIAAGADPLGAHARSNRRAGSAGVPLHRHRRDAGRNSRLVRPPLVRRDDVPGIPRPSGRRNRAAMVRSRHRANDASVARLVLARDALGGRSHSPLQPAPQIGRLVSEARTLLQRRNRRRSTVAVESADFINIPARPGSRGNSDHALAKTHRNALLRRVKSAKSS